MNKLRKLKDSCAVVALCYVSKVPEDVAIRVCTLFGYHGTGMEDDQWQAAAKQLGIDMRLVPLEESMRLHAFVRDHPNGLYLVWTVDHLLVVDNGKIIDPLHEPDPSTRRMVQGAMYVRE